jgi:hypothetical protein
MRESGIMRGAYRIRIRPPTAAEPSAVTEPTEIQRRRATGVCLAALAASASVAQAPPPAPGAAAPAAAPIELSQNDVFFISRWFRGTETKTYSALCGFAIHGNYLSHDLPRPEWEINIQALMTGAGPVVAVSAGAFQVVSKDAKAPRQPRAVISSLSFTVEGVAEPVSAQIAGQPGTDHAIKALVPTEPAQQLLGGLYDGKLITVAIGYQDGSAEVLKVRNVQDRARLSGFKGYYPHCMELLHPLPPGAASAYRINSPVELNSQDPFFTHE